MLGIHTAHELKNTCELKIPTLPLSLLLHTPIYPFQKSYVSNVGLESMLPAHLRDDNKPPVFYS